MRIPFLMLAICFLFSCTEKEAPLPGAPVTQTLYFPPIGSDTWETITPAALSWDVTKLNEAIAYVGSTKGYGLIILYKGRIVTEKYWNNWTMDTRYNIASAGKSVAAFLTGVAQQEGLLNINDKKSKYLGSAWTSLPAAKEDLITIRHPLTMTTGLDEGVADDNCLTPFCLAYKADAGTRWAYYNAP